MARPENCPLLTSCSKRGCDWQKLVEWLSKHQSETQLVSCFASSVAKYHCKDY